MHDELPSSAESGGSVGETAVDEVPTTTTTTTAPVPPPGRTTFGALGLAAVASLAAGAVHATAVGSHAGDDAVVRAFVAVAAFQLGWGALALRRPSRAVAVVGAVGNAACFGGWLLAQTVGIGFIDGFSEPEAVGFADGLAAALAAASVLLCLGSLFGVVIAKGAPKVRAGLVGAAAVVLAALALPGMVEAGQGHGDGGGHHGGQELVIPQETFDPDNVDLSGLPGVSPEQEARAEALVTDVVETLPRWADPATAYADGYRSINDDVTGVEHYINYDYIEDEHTLNPEFPESLMYRVDGDDRILEAAMFMMPDGTDLEDVPDIGGPMTQWHVHDNLCYTPDPEAPRVAGVYPPDQDCPGDLVRGDLNPMIHVWIVPNECGPFAALEGIPGGSPPEGEEQLCDHSNAEAVEGAPIF